MSTPQFNAKSQAAEVATALSAEIKDKTILVTGVSPNGLGAAFAEFIAVHQPKLIILAGRDISKAAQTAEAIAKAAPGVATRVLELDLGSQAKVRSAAKEVNAYSEVINVLVNNAAVMANPYATTEDGIESQFGTNHIGHFLFTNLILDKILLAGKGGRIINVASDGCRFGPVRFADLGFSKGETYDKWRAYGQAKSANMLFSISLAEKLGNKGLLTFSLHPGVIGTNLGRHNQAADFGAMFAFDRVLGNAQGFTKLIYKSHAEGTATHIVAAFDPSIAKFNGGHLSDCQILPLTEVPSWARDSVDAEKLWKASELLVGEKFTY